MLLITIIVLLSLQLTASITDLHQSIEDILHNVKQSVHRATSKQKDESLVSSSNSVNIVNFDSENTSLQSIFFHIY